MQRRNQDWRRITLTSCVLHRTRERRCVHFYVIMPASLSVTWTAKGEGLVGLWPCHFFAWVDFRVPDDMDNV